MDFFIAKNGTHQGPYTLDQLKIMGIDKDTLVYNDTLVGWTPAGEVPELNILFNGRPSVPPVPDRDYSCNEMPRMPKTWLLESILVTLFCCLPFGIVSIIKSSQVESLYRAGQYDASEQASRDAGKWVKLSFFIGLGLGLLGALLQLAGLGYLGLLQ